MTTLLERLKTEILVADGAMGTLLYADGLDTCHEAYNLSHPEKILSIHRAYIKAGADVIQTNTYGAKRHRLATYGLADQMVAINQAAVRLARQAAGETTLVLGTIGASRGLRHCELSLEAIVKETLEQAESLLATNQLDGLLLETYHDTEELLAVVKALRPLTDLPLVTNVSLQEVGLTANGKPVVEVLSQLTNLGADVVGLNCHLGPYHMLQSLEQLPLFAQSYLSVYPNASLLALQEEGESSQYSFRQNADYFGQISRLFVAEGARLIGGCCGTTPDHIRAAKKALKGLSPITKKIVKEERQAVHLLPTTSSGPTLIDHVKAGVTVIAEIDPPKTLDLTKFIAGVKALDQAGLAAITLADNSLASTRVCNLSLAALLKEEVDTPFLLHMACRDHNMIGLQSRLLGMDVLGIDNVLAVTGDPSKMGDFPGATSVYDFTSFKLLSLIKQLNQGQSHSGASLRKPTNFTVAAAFNPNIKNLSRSHRLIEKKIAAGADYFITQPIYSSAILEEMAELTAPYDQPFFIGIMPIVTYNNALFLHNEVPGISLSEDFLARLEAVKADKQACEAIGLAESKALIDKALELGFKGIYLITPFMRHDLTCQLAEYVKGYQNV